MNCRLGSCFLARIHAALLTFCIFCCWTIGHAASEPFEGHLPSPDSDVSLVRGQAEGANASDFTPQNTAHIADRLLARLLRDAETNNADMHVARARLKQAHAEHELAAAERRPWVSFGLAAERRRAGASYFRDSEGNRLRVPAYQHNFIDASLRAGYEMDVFGRQALRQASASALLAAEEAESRSVALAIRHAVIVAYADFRLATDLLALGKRALALQRAAGTRIGERVKAGADAARLEREAEDAADEIGREIARNLAHRKQAAARLAELLGESFAAVADELMASEPDYFAADLVLPRFVGDLPANALMRRPDITIAAKLLEASQADTERIRRERYPALTLTSSLGFASEGLSRWLRGEALSWLVGAAVVGPLFDGGRNAARFASAQAGSDVAAGNWRRQVHRALAEVESALSELEASDKECSLILKQFTRQMAAQAFAEQAYSGGRVSILQVLISKQRVLEHEARLRSVRHQQLAAWSASRLALGE